MSKICRILWTLSLLKNKTKSAQNVSKFRTYYGHILDIFPVFGHAFCSLFYMLEFGKILEILLDILNQFGHILDILWTYERVWTYFGHNMDTLGSNVSKMCPYHHCAPAPYPYGLCKIAQIARKNKSKFWHGI